MNRIAFILHGKVRHRMQVSKKLAGLFKTDFDIRIYTTTAPLEAEYLARQAIDEGCEYLIAVGGDGTLNEVVNGYMKYSGKKKRPVIGVLPWGTGNDFARGVGIKRSFEQLSGLIRNHSVRNIDAGILRFNDPDGGERVRYFDNIADLGMGADVVGRVNGVNLRKRILGSTLVFFLSVLYTFITYRHKRVQVTWGDSSWQGPMLAIIVANGKYFGSGLGIAPDASFNDGFFELVILGQVRVLDYLKNISKLRRGIKIDHPEVYYHRTAKVRVTMDGDVAMVESDGETEGMAPVEFECLKGVLPMLIPAF